jgi:hypothetical protein
MTPPCIDGEDGEYGDKPAESGECHVTMGIPLVPLRSEESRTQIAAIDDGGSPLDEFI